jgi:CBS domain-containing protein
LRVVTTTTVREVMSVGLVTVEPTATIAEAATVMGADHVSSAMVISDGRPVGIFTERDVVRALADHPDAAHRPVSEYMTPDPITIAPEATVDQALEVMLRCDFRHLPVTQDEMLIGVVSIRDLSAELGR